MRAARGAREVERFLLHSNISPKDAANDVGGRGPLGDMGLWREFVRVRDLCLALRRRAAPDDDRLTDIEIRMHQTYRRWELS